ncbi:hypothetical protein FIBSPDRAFT_929757 [Athelia psychrophila]|uniref:Uncharacterized protein n=1 Tax=Athelia psychrophila TaxID=1759441 RepID=A0A166N191_9AGAM|nr:hypothetical protein FIBSPDRAFT_929757 [Fibularhizoctonia sp. CBS 109695]
MDAASAESSSTALCALHTRRHGGWTVGEGCWATGYGLRWRLFGRLSKGPRQRKRLRAVHMLGPDATSTHRKLAEGHSVDHSAIELLCARAAVADDMIYCITQDGRGPRSG